MVDYITELVGFAVVLFVIGRWVVPVINKGMTQRQEAIRQQLEEAEEAKKRLAIAREKYDDALAEARREAERLRERAQQESTTIAAEMREQAQVEARRIVEQAHQQIEADHQQTLTKLRATVGRLTAELAGEIVEVALTDGGRQSRVLDRVLDEIEARDTVAVR